VDPGFGNTGLVLRLFDSSVPVSAVCWANDETADWDIRRAVSITTPLIEQIVAWVFEHDIKSLEVCIESPIYNGNAKVLMIQMSLYTLIQAYVYERVLPVLDECYLTVVHNTTSKKKLAHDGKATKEQMIQASPWGHRGDLSYNQKHTLADAYAHSLSGGMQQWALHKMAPYVQESNCEG
jgi:hypothetical protein